MSNHNQLYEFFPHRIEIDSENYVQLHQLGKIGSFHTEYYHHCSKFSFHLSKDLEGEVILFFPFSILNTHQDIESMMIEMSNIIIGQAITHLSNATFQDIDFQAPTAYEFEPKPNFNNKPLAQYSLLWKQQNFCFYLMDLTRSRESILIEQNFHHNNRSIGNVLSL
jgi:hypothetical protein